MLVYIIRLLFKSGTFMFHCIDLSFPTLGIMIFVFGVVRGNATGVVVENLDQTGNPTENYRQKAYNKFHAPLANTAVGNGM